MCIRKHVCCIFETKIRLYINDISINKKERIECDKRGLRVWVDMELCSGPQPRCPRPGTRHSEKGDSSQATGPVLIPLQVPTQICPKPEPQPHLRRPQNHPNLSNKQTQSHLTPRPQTRGIPLPIPSPWFCSLGPGLQMMMVTDRRANTS